MIKMNVSTLTRASASGETCFVASFAVSPRWRYDTTRESGLLSALSVFVAGLVPGLFSLRLMVIVSGNIGHARHNRVMQDNVSWGSWPVQAQFARRLRSCGWHSARSPHWCFYVYAFN